MWETGASWNFTNQAAICSVLTRCARWLCGGLRATTSEPHSVPFRVSNVAWRVSALLYSIHVHALMPARACPYVCSQRAQTLTSLVRSTVVDCAQAATATSGQDCPWRHRCHSHLLTRARPLGTVARAACAGGHQSHFAELVVASGSGGGGGAKVVAKSLSE